MAAIPDPASGPWHMDKRIPIAIVTTLLFQSAAIVWWASGMNAAVMGMTKKMDQHDTRIAAVETSLGVQSVNAAVLTQQLVSLREDLAELKSAQAETNRLLRDLGRSSVQ